VESPKQPKQSEEKESARELTAKGPELPVPLVGVEEQSKKKKHEHISGGEEPKINRELA